MSYRKVVAGVANQSNETASNNKIHSININDGRPLGYAVIFVIVLACVVIGYMWIAHPDILAALVTGSFCAVFVVAWIAGVQWIRRDASNTRTVIEVNNAVQERARYETRVLIATDNYILYRDENEAYQFRGTVTVTENRHFPAQIEAPKVPDDRTILELFDKGLSARAIEKTFEKKIPYRHIAEVLTTYRPSWNVPAKRVVESSNADVEDEPYA